MKHSTQGRRLACSMLSRLTHSRSISFLFRWHCNKQDTKSKKPSSPKIIPDRQYIFKDLPGPACLQNHQSTTATNSIGPASSHDNEHDGRRIERPAKWRCKQSVHRHTSAPNLAPCQRYASCRIHGGCSLRARLF
jgi:hypothetical protein